MIVSFKKSSILNAALVGNTYKPINLCQVDMTIYFFISTPKNIHVFRSKVLLFEIHLTVLLIGFSLIVFGV